MERSDATPGTWCYLPGKPSNNVVRIVRVGLLEAEVQYSCGQIGTVRLDALRRLGGAGNLNKSERRLLERTSSF